MKELNLQILKLARESRLITQEELAGLIGIEQGTLSKIQKGILKAEEATVAAIAKVLNYPIDFFYLEKNVIAVEGHYRRKLSIPVKKMKQYIAQMTIAEWNFLSMLDEIELPEPNLPKWDVLTDGGVTLCAKHLREFWKIPKGRIADLTKFAEDNGIVIIQLELGDMIGFSTYIGGSIPVVFINKNLSPDRYRLTLAHEIGHLILHFGNKINADRNLEEEAYQFAIELLVPENNIRPYLAKITLERLADLKGYWYVSMGALLKYANSLGMVSGNQYRYLWTQMGSHGYRTKEPVAIPSEKPSIIPEMINAYLSDLGYTKEELAKVFFLNVEEFDRIYLNSRIKLKAI